MCIWLFIRMSQARPYILTPGIYKMIALVNIAEIKVKVLQYLCIQSLQVKEAFRCKLVYKQFYSSPKRSPTQQQEKEITETAQNLGSEFLLVERPQVMSYSGRTKCNI